MSILTNPCPYCRLPLENDVHAACTDQAERDWAGDGPIDLEDQLDTLLDMDRNKRPYAYRPYAYVDGRCVECWATDGGHFDNCAAIN